MTQMYVNPTRMELQRLKRQLTTATRSHKLLKDKRDELMRQFLALVQQARALRRTISDGFAEIRFHSQLATAMAGELAVEQAFLCSAGQISLEVHTERIVGVEVPVYTLHSQETERFPYGFAQTSGELDEAVFRFRTFFPDLIRLAQTEAAVYRLAQEIESTRRRVNALEYVRIPQYKETIRHIALRLEEAERSNTIRLMKVNEQTLRQAREHGA